MSKVMTMACAFLALVLTAGVVEPAQAQREGRGEREGEIRKPADLLREILRYGQERGEARKASCDHYGRQSIVQGESAAKFRCNFRGARWIPNYNAHFDWCLYTKPDVVLKEVELRERELSQCFAELDEQGDVSADCERYARRATRLALRNEDLRCGEKGSEWNVSYERQLAMCRRLNDRGRQETLEAMRDEIERCRSR